MKPKLPIRFKIGEDLFEPDYQEELKISKETLNKNLVEQPGFFAWYAVLAELAEQEYGAAKLELELTEAKVDERVREAAFKKNEKITEPMVRNRMRLDDEYVAAVVKRNEWKKNVGICKAVKEAFAHRKDMLVTFSSNWRLEHDLSIMIKKKEYEKKLD